ncbi:MAG: hypothetical protein UY84_C0001G0137 [Candidatus Adlerbacteria bacterium GW2011_GWA2_54_12]|nr:MAG: hypothetical protein UY84_C0001G0137 [Candidatus Adlerbacteria bacterium GW2011_GWA2_54_12]
MKPTQPPPPPQRHEQDLNLSGATAASKVLGEMHSERDAQAPPTASAPMSAPKPTATSQVQRAQTPSSSVLADLWSAKRGTEAPNLEPLTGEIRKLRQTIKRSAAEVRNRPPTADRATNIEKGLKEIAREAAKEKPSEINLKINTEKKPWQDGSNPPIIR